MKTHSSLLLSFIISLALAFSGAAQDGKDRNKGRDQKPDERKKTPVVIEEKPKNDRDRKDDRGSGDRKKNNYY